jgi:hypothetical protein
MRSVLCRGLDAWRSVNASWDLRPGELRRSEPRLASLKHWPVNSSLTNHCRQCTVDAMVPPSTAAELIATIRSDAATGDALDELLTAAATVASLEEAADAALEFFVDQCRRDGRTWSVISGALGVTKQAAHKRFTAPSPAAELFTQRAQSALRAAGEEAHALSHNYVGTEHVLLGLFEPSGGIAAQVLTEAGVTRAQVVNEITKRVPSTPQLAQTASPPYTPRASRSRDRALAEAVSLGHNYIGTEHLLLALFEYRESLAAQALDALGVQRDDVRASIIEKLSGYKPRPT